MAEVEIIVPGKAPFGHINGHQFQCRKDEWTLVPRVVAWGLAGLGYQVIVRG